MGGFSFFLNSVFVKEDRSYRSASASDTHALLVLYGHPTGRRVSVRKCVLVKPMKFRWLRCVCGTPRGVISWATSALSLQERSKNRLILFWLCVCVFVCCLCSSCVLFVLFLFLYIHTHTPLCTSPKNTHTYIL